MLLAFKELKSINLNNKYPSFALGKLEDTRHLTLVLNTTLSFTTQKHIVVVKRPNSLNYLLFGMALAIHSQNVLPQHDINVHASNINKLHIALFGNEHTLHRNGFTL